MSCSQIRNNNKSLELYPLLLSINFLFFFCAQFPEKQNQFYPIEMNIYVDIVYTLIPDMNANRDNTIHNAISQ